MKKIIVYSSLALMSLLFITSCSKTGPTGPSGPALTGTLTGYVTTYDQYGFKVLGDISEVTVHISDTTSDSTLTTSSGQYTFSNLKTGVYNLVYSKAGYAPVTAYDYAFVGGGTQLRAATLSRYPSFSLFGVNDTIETLNTDPGVLIRGTDTVDQVQRSYAVFASSSASVTSAPGTYTYSNSSTIKAGAATFSLFITSQELHDNGLASGSTVYFIVYPYSTGSPTYVDPATGRTVFTTLGTPATVFSAIIP